MHIIVGLETGGAESMLFRLVNAMPHHTHIIISLTTIGSIGQQLIANGHTVHAVGFRLPVVWRSLAQLWRLIKKYRPDVIQTWMYHSDLLGGIVGRLAGVRNIVWNVRNTEIPQRYFSSTGLVIRCCAAISSFVPRAIVCCAYAGRKSHVSLGYCRKRIVVIPNGYNIQDWQPSMKGKIAIRSELGLPVDAFIIGIVGRFDPLKGYDVFVKAASRVSEDSCGNVLFLMVGHRVDENNSELRNIIAKFGKNARFILMGEQRNISQIMSALDVYCLSSVAEGFPNVVAEAMLMEVPCVVTDVGDVRKIAGTTGTVVPPRHPAALADALLAIQRLDQTQRNNLGRTARQRIVDNYDIELIAQHYSRLYERNDS